MVASDARDCTNHFSVDGPFEQLDVTSRENYTRVVRDYKVDSIIHLASLLSANGELDPQLALRVNVGGSNNALELAMEHNC